MKELGDRIMAMLEAAAVHSEPGPGVTRTFCSPEHAAAAGLILGWMRDAGLTAEIDPVGNVVGRIEGTDPDAGTLILGSHQDTVVSGGKYDGMLGVALPIACMHHLADAGQALPYTVEIVAFGDEEGTRFQATLVGSRALAGTFDPAMLEARDRHGTSLGEALQAFGGDPAGIPGLARDPERTLGFLEVHIEQGPILESEGLAVGVVTAITGIERHRVTLAGMAGHAGTVPMEKRRDALCCAAEAVLAVERVCRETEDAVGVVGKLENRPNAVNVIPSEVEFTVELRSPDPAVRQGVRERVFAAIEAVARDRGIDIAHDRTYEAEGIRCAPWMVEGLSESVGRIGVAPRLLFSGAGHDGLAMDRLCDVGMIFVRCRDGLSHHPDEAITPDDAGVAAATLIDFLANELPRRLRN